MKPARKREAAMLRAVVDDLHEMRKARKLKRKAIADDIGYHWQTIARWERGETLPSTSALVWWCASLGAELRVDRPAGP